ncbi:MAG: hypothetical protein KDC07_04870 [Chitinophagaceae bacterium]|nr:hypothetical protein [Chitinophagaceae bacterium]MCB9044858.1 hypothetical protein [Chitinophagales bacterium]
MELYVSAGSIDITPEKPVALFGFAERHGLYSRIHDSLEINLSALKQDSKLVLIYSVDTLFTPEDFTKLVLDKFGGAYGLTEKDIWMAATHTHFAPSLDKEKPGLGHFDDAYYNYVADKLLLLTEQVLKASFTKVSIHYGNSQSVLNVNRRKKLLRPKPKGKFGLYRKVLMYPDFNGPKDKNIHTIKLVGEDGKTKMVLWNYACHPVGFVHRSQVTSEFIGVIRDEMRAHYKHPKMPVVFLLGFAGNLKPDVTPVTHTRLKDKIRYFFQLGPEHTRFPNTDAYMDWAEMLWKEVKEALHHADEISGTTITTSKNEIPLNEIIGDHTFPVHFYKLKLADELQFIGVSAEVLVEYKDIVKEALKGQPSINVGCLAGTHIYLPTDKHVKEGGYEVHWFQHRFAIVGEFKNNLNDKIKAAVAQL